METKVEVDYTVDLKVTPIVRDLIANLNPNSHVFFTIKRHGKDFIYFYRRSVLIYFQIRDGVLYQVYTSNIDDIIREPVGAVFSEAKFNFIVNPQWPE